MGFSDELNAGGMRVGIVSDPIQHNYASAVDGYHYLFWNSGLTFDNRDWISMDKM